MIHPHPPSPLFPYTTLFRSRRWVPGGVVSRNDARLATSAEGRLEYVAEVGTRVRAGERVAKLEDKDRKSTRLNSSHLVISYAVFCLKKKKIEKMVVNTNRTE